MSGRLYVIEGLDGSGKATQARRLADTLRERHLPAREISFPNYGSDSSALVKMYLSGQFGSQPSDVNAWAASTFYAVDRYCSYKQDWGGYYENGGVLIADRYTTSNAVHQASKLPKGERKAFLDWLFGFEYGKLGLPEPTAVFYLDVPTELTERMMRRREAETNTGADIHERDEAYLRACREAGEQLVTDYGWQYVDCSRDGEMRSIEDIHEEIYRRAKALL